jgi:hypothetical protein
MSDMGALITAYERHVALPWPSNLSPAERVWMIIYSPRDERRIRARVTAFQIATTKSRHGWQLVDITETFALWLGKHPYRETYFKQPELLSGAAIRDFEKLLTKRVTELAGPTLDDPEAVVALIGVGALFPFTKVSRLIESVAPQVKGRLVVFFPGERDGSNYRLLEARDGWSYLATPISATEEMP